MSKETTLKRVLTRKTALHETRIEQLPVLPLQDGETLLQVSGVALTTNNITYALLGDTMQYWSFFPTHAAEWGQMPAWGFADTPRWS